MAFTDFPIEAYQSYKAYQWMYNNANRVLLPFILSHIFYAVKLMYIASVLFPKLQILLLNASLVTSSTSWHLSTVLIRALLHTA